MTLKLEVGKTYITKPVKISPDEGDENYPFKGDNGEFYTIDGKFYYSGDDPRDLISEAPQPSPEKPTERILTSGLTLREHFAGLALQGMLAAQGDTGHKFNELVKEAVSYSEQLIFVLEGRG